MKTDDETLAGGTDAPRFEGDYNDEEHMDRIHSQSIQSVNDRDFWQAYHEAEKDYQENKI